MHILHIFGWNDSCSGRFKGVQGPGETPCVHPDQQWPLEFYHNLGLTPLEFYQNLGSLAISCPPSKKNNLCPPLDACSGYKINNSI